ncbi:MAG: carboxymuconolactone decarboxylase family protein [Oxalobacter sp.]
MYRKTFVTVLISFLIFNTNVFAKGIRNMTRQEIADSNLGTLFNITTKNNNGPDKEFMDILQKYIFGEVFTVGNLDIKTRELLTVTSLSVMQTLPQLKAHINGALNAGIQPVEIRETIYQCAPFIGFPKTLNAISIFNEVVKERGLEKELKSASTVKEEERFEKGSAIQNPIYGDEIVKNMKGLPNDMDDDVARFLTEVCFGDFYTRESLDIKKRELMTIAVLTTIGNTGVLKSHIKGNLKAGNSIKTITAAIIQVMPYVGFPNAFAALNTVKEVINEQ